MTDQTPTEALLERMWGNAERKHHVFAVRNVDADPPTRSLTDIRARPTPPARKDAAMTDLAERIEAAGVDEQRAMMEEAFVCIHGTKPERVHGGSQEWKDWLDLHNPFLAMLEAKAYESAAMMLGPEGWEPRRITWFHNAVEVSMASGFATSTGRAATPALALAAAAIRAGAK